MTENYRPYTISIPDSHLEDLKTRLSLAKFPDELDEAGWDYGAPLADVKRLTTYWKDSYDWRKAETELNKLPQYTTSIQCPSFEPLEIHFIHRKSSRQNAIPLLFIHGWPGSYLEVTKILEPLTTPTSPSQPAFHVIAPSLPNYAFSQGSKKKGFSAMHYAETCHKLMLSLGYNEYITQGGDWGFYLSRAISLMYPEHCRATHLNMDQGTAPPFTSHPLLALEHMFTPYTPAEKAGLERTKWFINEGSGYRAEQSTKPQTLMYGLTDSPVALMAWVYEKLHDWTDGYPWTDDEVCTWMSIYWFSRMGAGASVRIYYETTHEWGQNTPTAKKLLKEKGEKVTRDRLAQWIGGGVKIGITHSPRDLRVLPSVWTRAQGNVVFERTWESGGHFLAWEKPDHLVKDVREMFGKGGGAERVVKGRSGYD